MDGDVGKRENWIPAALYPEITHRHLLGRNILIARDLCPQQLCSLDAKGELSEKHVELVDLRLAFPVTSLSCSGSASTQFRGQAPYP